MFRKRGSQLARNVDFYIGVPIVLLLSLFRSNKRTLIQTPQRIGILISAAIGDSIIFAPFLTAIKRALPSSKLVLFVGSSNVPTIPLLSDVDQVVEISPYHFLVAAKTIRAAGEFDLWFDVGQWPRLNAILSFLSRSHYRVGFRTPGQFRHYVYDTAVLHSNQIHEWENFSRLIRSCLNISASYPNFQIDHGAEKNQIVIHPFAGGAKPYLKEWPDIKWKKLVDHLTDRGHDIVLSAGDADRERAEQLRNLFESKEKVRLVPLGTSLRALGTLMRESKLVISVNTGAMHLASAVGVKTVGIHGPTSSLRWGPLGSHSQAVTSKLSCSPCLNLGFDYGCPKNLCMLEIPVERVTEAVDELLIGVSVPKPAQQREKQDFKIKIMRPVSDIE